ncbi:Hypothetical predicted protein [Cloeon dipterum]|nr:Hypothetical predicted protein [Cloeon dipterum]
MFGSTVGFILASFSLEIFVDPALKPEFGTTDPRWIGAWWLGWIPLGTMTLIFGSMMYMFPRSLPRTLQRNVEATLTPQEVTKPSLKDFKDTIKRLLKNKILMCNNMSTTFIAFGFYGQWLFMPKYMETQFHLSAATSNLATGSIGLLFTAAGLLASAVVISKFKPSARLLAGWNVFSEIIDVLGFVSILLISCESLDFKWTILSDGSKIIDMPCNADCACHNSMKYSPVCHISSTETFFSPCHAGCRQSYLSQNGAKVFTDCSCTLDDNPVLDGPCALDCKSAFVIFVVVQCVQRFLGATGRAGNCLIHFRCVHLADKAVSFALLQVMLCILVLIPGPIIFGSVIDMTCSLWGMTCGKIGNCWIYDAEKLRHFVYMPILGCLIMGTLWDIGVWYYAKGLPIYEENDPAKDGEQEAGRGAGTTNRFAIAGQSITKTAHSLLFSESPATADNGMNSTTWTAGGAPKLGTLDLCVFGAMLLASAAIGCYFGLFRGGQRSAVDYLMGGRQMGMLPVALSLVASFISGISIMGDPAEVYRHGTQYWIIGGSAFVSSLAVGTIYAPIYLELQLTSCYQVTINFLAISANAYLKLRYNESVRKMASVMFIISQFLYIPIVIYAPALALSQVTGLNVHLITPIISAICIFYTTIGGLRAVVWTDTLQTCLMMLAMVVVIAMGVTNVGGWQKVWDAADRGARLEFFNMNPNPLERHTFWTVLIGQSVYMMSWCATSQGMVQRYLAVPDLRTARQCLLCFAVGLASVKGLSVATGLLLYAEYENCDPISEQRVTKQDQILPLYVLETAGHIPGLSGLFVVGVFSAALSSMSTGLNALSGVLVEDLFARWIPPTGFFSSALWLRVAALSTGIVCVLLVMAVEHLGSVLQMALSLGSITNGTMLGLFTMGIFFPFANSKGALVGTLSSLVLNGGLVLSTQFALARGALRHSFLPLSTIGCSENSTTIAIPTEPVSDVWPLLEISYMYYSLIGAALVPMVGLPVSWLTGGRRRKLSPQLFSPYVQRFLPSTDLPQEQVEMK